MVVVATAPAFVAVVVGRVVAWACGTSRVRFVFKVVFGGKKAAIQTQRSAGGLPKHELLARNAIYTAEKLAGEHASMLGYFLQQRALLCKGRLQDCLQETMVVRG